MTQWNGGPSFWVFLDCEDLFELFEESAEANDGRPILTADQVDAHVDGCGTCWDADVRVETSIDGRALSVRQETPSILS